MIIRILKMLIALPKILLFGILRLLANIISKVYCYAAAIVLIPLAICLVPAVIITDWLAVAIFGALIAICFILLFSIGWIMVELEFGQEFFKGLMHG